MSPAAARRGKRESGAIPEATRRIVSAVLLLVLLGFAAVRAHAQTPPSGGDAPSPQASEALDRLITVLEDPVAREQLLQQLRSLKNGTGPDAAGGPAGAVPGPAAREEAARALESFEQALRERVTTAGRAFRELLQSYKQLRFLYAWLRQELADPARRSFLFGNFAHLAFAALVGLLGAWAMRLLWRRLRPAPAAGDRPAIAERLVLALRLFAYRFAAVLGFVTAAHLFIVATSETPLLVIVSRHVLGGLLVGRSIAALTDALLAPGQPQRRLLAFDDATAHNLARWITALNLVAVYGTVVLWAAWDFGLPWTIYGFLSRLLYLIAVVLLITLLWRYRRPVAEVLEARLARAESPLGRFLPWQRVARSWHLLASALILAHYFAFALQLPGGVTFFLVATLLTLVIVTVARLAWLLVDQLFGRSSRSPEEPSAVGPRPRSRVYLQLLRVAARAVILIAAILLVLDAWGLGLLGWLLTGPGRAVVGQLLRLFAVLAVALLLAEAASAVAGHYMRATTPDGRPLYGNRTRTLASIVRNLAITLIAAVALMTVLSQFGIETGPLLAGAGIVGLALGFGSQKLVQDLITGLFILLGDTIRVGDVVDTGGKAGVVEAMSMRTITLRGYDGNVHTVPYSSIDTVTNMTKDFAFWVMNIGVAYQEDVDRVMAVLRELDEEMRKEWPWRRLMLAPIDVAGLDQFGDSAVIIKARLKTRPGEQWGVGREFQRRMKKRFDELGIEIPFPHRTLYFGVDKEGRAPPLHIKPVGDTDRETVAGGRTGPPDRPAED